MKIDQTDIKILEVLEKDCRLSIREISRQVNLSAPSVAERIRKLEENGVIEGYSLKVNKGALGVSLNCIIEVTLKNGEYEKFLRMISEHPRSIFCYRVAGKSCFIIKLAVYSLIEVEQFINEISLFAYTVTHIVLSEAQINSSITKWLFAQEL